jgi:hypothetical protein
MGPPKKFKDGYISVRYYWVFAVLKYKKITADIKYQKPNNTLPKKAINSYFLGKLMR